MAQEDDLDEQLQEDMQTIQKQMQDLAAQGGTVSEDSIKQLSDFYRGLSPRETKDQLREKFKDVPLLNNPKVIDFCDDLLRDQFLMQNLYKILANKTKLLWFVLCNILVFVIGFWLKKRRAAQKEKTNFGLLSRFILWCWRFLIGVGVRIGIIIAFYGQEFTPLFRLLQKHFF